MINSILLATTTVNDERNPNTNNHEAFDLPFQGEPGQVEAFVVGPDR